MEGRAGQVKVLFLAANPEGSTRLAIGEEFRDITARLNAAGAAARFDLRFAPEARAVDLSHLLQRHQPDVVHFSGHCDQGGALVLPDEAGGVTLVEPEAVARLFRELSPVVPVRCVVLNACHTEGLARALAPWVDCVIGTTAEVGDLASRAFAGAFYEALAFGHDAQTAFGIARAQVRLADANQRALPVLYARHPGAARALRFVDAPAGPDARRAWPALAALAALAVMAVAGGVAWRIRRGAQSPPSLTVAPRPDGYDALSARCERGDADACAAAGRSLAEGSATEPSAPRVVRHLDAACSHGSAEACARLAAIRWGTSAAGRDADGATALWRRACDAGHLAACADWGRAALAAAPARSALPSVADACQRACAGAVARGCTCAGDALTAIGGAGDAARAAELYREGCDRRDAAGCAGLATALAEGRGVMPDDARALALLLRSCDGGVAWACSRAGDLLAAGRGAAPDDARAATLFRRGCEAGDGEGCGRLASAHESGRGAPRDEVTATTLYRHACDLGVAASCTSLGQRVSHGLGAERDDGGATEAFRRACDGGDALGCSLLATHYHLGRGVARDRTLARALFQRACAGGHQPACANALR